MVKIPIWGELEEIRWDVPAKRARKRVTSSFLHLTFCFLQALSWLDGAHPQSRGQSTLLTQPVQMIISSRSTLHRYAQLGTSEPVKLTHTCLVLCPFLLFKNLSFASTCDIIKEYPVQLQGFFICGPWNKVTITPIMSLFFHFLPSPIWHLDFNLLNKNLP